jgi:hypothetical protein
MPPDPTGGIATYGLDFPVLPAGMRHQTLHENAYRARASELRGRFDEIHIHNASLEVGPRMHNRPALKELFIASGILVI